MIEVIPELVEVNGRKRIKVTIRDGERVVDADLIDPFQSAQRRKASQRLAERAGDPNVADRIEQALLQCVDLMNAPPTNGDEVDANEPAPQVMTVVRPELIISEGVVAVSVPEVIVRDGEAVGRWRIYLRMDLKDQAGKPEELDASGAPARAAHAPVAAAAPRAPVRLCRPLTSRIEGGTTELWVHPVPGAPSPSTPAGWTPAARRAWLEGASDPDPVALFDDVCAAIEEYLDVEEESAGPARMDDGGSRMGVAHAAPSSMLPRPSSPPLPPLHPLIATLALWVMLTYVYVAWDAVPYLFVTGPAGSGKTRVFELLSRMVFRPLASSNLSAPALFRTLHDRGGTLLLDEAERLTEGGDDVAELRSILLAGYKRGGRASRLESAGDNYQMSEFQVFGPKAIACINGLPPALASRCVLVPMFRSPPGSEKPRRRIDADPQRWLRLRDALHALLLGPLGATALELANEPGFCPLGGRQYELWQPLLALAGWIDCERSKRQHRAKLQAAAAPAHGAITPTPGVAASVQTIPPLHPRLLDYARSLCETGSENLLPEEDFLLLWTLTDKVVRGQEPTCKIILERARSADADALRGVSARRVAEILKRYGLQSTRCGGKNLYRNLLEQLKLIEVRYGVDLNTAGKENVNILKGRYY